LWRGKVAISGLFGLFGLLVIGYWPYLGKVLGASEGDYHDSPSIIQGTTHGIQDKSLDILNYFSIPFP
jgi:hypothetical protein